MEIKPIHQNSCRFIKNVMYDKGYGGISADGENDVYPYIYFNYERAFLIVV